MNFASRNIRLLIAWLFCTLRLLCAFTTSDLLTVKRRTPFSILRTDKDVVVIHNDHYSVSKSQSVWTRNVVSHNHHEIDTRTSTGTSMSTKETTAAATATSSATNQASNDEEMIPRRNNNKVTELVSGTIAWHSLVGQADRAFRLGIQLEKNGQARKAGAAFHEALTLYQCFLDSESDFGHVTSLPRDDCLIILAYACLRLGFLNKDALGDPKAAVRLYKMAAALDPYPSAASYEGLGQALEASQGGTLVEAVAAYRTALKLSPGRKSTMFHLAVALDRLGQNQEAEQLLDVLRRQEAVYACLVDTWGYLRWHIRKVPQEKLNLQRGTRDMLSLALQAAAPLIEEGGLVAEFGVGSGRSLRMTQELLPLDTPIHGFDTFTGLPQAWGNEPAGTYSTGGMVPNMEGSVYFHKGLFGDTIKPFLKEAGPDTFLAYANIDCDLYSSTLDILESMHGRVVPGTILVFDEYIGHSTWRQDEFRAWRECCKRFGWKYEYLAFSLSTTQAVVRVISA